MALRNGAVVLVATHPDGVHERQAKLEKNLVARFGPDAAAQLLAGFTVQEYSEVGTTSYRLDRTPEQLRLAL